MRYWLVMPAAGSSQRFGGAQPKQFSPLAGSTVMELALRPFLEDPRCAGAVVVLAAQQLQQAAANTHASDHAGSGAAAHVLRVAGGARRCDSVLCGLAALESHAAADDWVLVHDAARPCLSAADLTQLCFDDLDGPPVVVGSRNWITPAAELETLFFPQPAWLLDAIHERILPLKGYQPETNQTLGEMLRRSRLGI